MSSLDRHGAEWLADKVGAIVDTIDRVKPSEFNERTRYLPNSVTSMPGYIRFSVNPYMREIVDCFDIDSPVREVNVKKGVQVTYTTVLESGLLYFMAHVKTLPIMYMTADKELATARIENNIIPMLQQSGLAHIIRSADEGNSRKTGKTKNHLQWEGGGYLVPFGAINADKMRSFSIAVMIKDEIDAWKETVGKDGDPDKLSDARLSAYWERRKIFRGSTPLIKGSSKIDKQYKRGDQRIYLVRCFRCNFPQALRWHTVDPKTGIVGGFDWELDSGGTLILESVRYRCQACGHEHFEHDKERLFSEDEGAHWKPTARPVEPGIRSYHLPAMYSPIGMQPWYKCVSDYLEAFDPIEKRVKDVGKLQVFYNNILAEAFEIQGSKIRFVSVSAHRRHAYRYGEIPNEYAEQYAGGRVLFLVCTVDVQKSNLAVTVWGVCREMRVFTIDYWRIEADDCGDPNSPAWGRLREIIEEKIYTAADGREYRIIFTLIDAGYANDTVTKFCADYAAGVYPILGRDRPSKNQAIKEFAEFKTQAGGVGYRIVVDHYKDRIAPVLRREWIEEMGPQPAYHFNAPLDATDAQIKELTTETRRQKEDDHGNIVHYWYRPSGVANEFFDLLGYAHAAVDILAWSICVKHFGLETIEWARFWDYAEANL